ncbi:hypothetical protein GW950_00575 [Candidatus Wolfebacteria bacterium]|nr:hypothetical protein [Candidatus Wolfebacteria bacterium]
MLYNIKRFFDDIAEKDEDAKKLWLIILTSISMVIVITLWGMYINIAVEDLNSQQQVVQKESFIDVMKNGAVAVSAKSGLGLSQLTASLKSIVSKSNSIIIERQNKDFLIKNDLDSITPVLLP